MDNLLDTRDVKVHCKCGNVYDDRGSWYSFNGVRVCCPHCGWVIPVHADDGRVEIHVYHYGPPPMKVEHNKNSMNFGNAYLQLIDRGWQLVRAGVYCISASEPLSYEVEVKHRKHNSVDVKVNVTHEAIASTPFDVYRLVEESAWAAVFKYINALEKRDV